MKNHLGLVVGVGMLATAGVVLSQLNTSAGLKANLGDPPFACKISTLPPDDDGCDDVTTKRPSGKSYICSQTSSITNEELCADTEKFCSDTANQPNEGRCRSGCKKGGKDVSAEWRHVSDNCTLVTDENKEEFENCELNEYACIIYDFKCVVNTQCVPKEPETGGGGSPTRTSE